MPEREAGGSTLKVTATISAVKKAASFKKRNSPPMNIAEHMNSEDPNAIMGLLQFKIKEKMTRKK